MFLYFSEKIRIDISHEMPSYFLWKNNQINFRVSSAANLLSTLRIHQGSISAKYLEKNLFPASTQKIYIVGTHQNCHDEAVPQHIFIEKYRIYSKHSDTCIPCLSCPNNWTSVFFLFYICLYPSGWVANSEDPDQMLHPAASDLGLHCLLQPVCSNT